MQAGQHVTPTIKLLRPLGEGAMGCVWVAEHLALGTPVAVKVMAPNYAQDARLVARFRQEAQSAARLKSPHATHVLDHGITAEGQPYIVMELLEGETLRTCMQRSGPMPLDAVARAIVQTAKALAAAHRIGVVHRDIKPDNLFLIDVEGESFVKVLDFGIAKQADASGDITSEGMMLGTPMYMSPEQLSNATLVDHRADLWALGVVAYEALTGAAPFTGSTLLALALSIQKGVFLPPSALRPELPPATDAWMARALAVAIEARFNSAMAMAEALSTTAQGANQGERQANEPASGTQMKELAATLYTPLPKTVIAPRAAVAAQPKSPVLPEPASAPQAAVAAEPKPDECAPEPSRREAISERSQRSARKGELPVRGAASTSEEPTLSVVHDPVKDTLSLFGPGLTSQAIVFDPRSAALIVGFLTGAVLCLDLRTRRPRWWRHLSSSAQCITAGAGWVAVGCVQGDVHLLDAASGTLMRTLHGQGGPVLGIDGDPRGERLATCSSDNRVTLWSVATGERLLASGAHSGGLGSVAFDPSSSGLASGEEDSTVHLWDAGLQPTRVLQIDRGSAVSLSFSPGGHFLAAGCDDGGIRIWGTRRWQLNSTLSDHKKRVASVTFFGPYRRVLSGSLDGTVRIWDVDTGRALRVLGDHEGAIECVAASPDGRYAASACADGRVRIYQAPTAVLMKLW